MKILICILIVTLAIFPNGALYAEVILDKPMTMGTQVRSVRTPQDIIADFQNTVDKIQQEHQSLYNEINVKNKENTFLLKKINDMSVRLLQLDYALSKRSKPASSNAQDYSALIQEKETLLKSYDQAMASKTKLEVEISKLKEQNDSLESTKQESLETLRSALDASKIKAKEQSETLDVLKKEKEETEVNYQIAIDEKTALQEQLRILDAKLIEVQSKEDEKPTQTQVSLQLRNRELSDRLDQMIEDIREKDNAIAKYKSQAVKAEGELKKIQAQNQEISAQLQKLSSTVNTAQDDRSEKISILESKLAETQNTIKKMTKENADARTDLSGFEAERRKLNSQIIVLKEQIEKDRTKNNGISRSSNAPDALQLRALQKNLDKTYLELHSKNKLIGELKTKIESFSDQSARDNKSAQGDLGEIETLKAKVDEKDSLLKIKIKAVEDLTLEKKKLLTQVDSLKLEKTKLSKLITELKDRKPAERTSGELYKGTEQSSLEEKLADLNKRFNESENQLKDKEMIVERLTNQQREDSNKIDSMEREKKTLQVKIQSLEEQLIKARSKDSDLSGLNENSVIELSELRGELKARIQESSNDRIEIEKLQSEIKAIDTKREQAEKESVALKEKLNNQDVVSESRISQVKSQLEAMIDKLNTQINDQSVLLKEKENVITQLNTEKLNNQQSLELNSKEKEVLTQKVDDLKKSLASITIGQASTVTDSAISSAREKENIQLQRTKDALLLKDSQLEELKDQNKQIGSKLNIALKERSNSQNELSKLKNQLETIKDDSQKNNRKLESDLNRKLESLREELSVTRQKLTAKEDLVADLTVKMDGLNQKIDELSQEKKQTNVSKELIIAEDPESLNQRGATEKEKLSTVIKERDAIRRQLNSTISEGVRLKAELGSLQKNNAQLERSAKENAERSQKELAAIKKDNSSLKVNLKVMTQKAESAGKENEKIQNKLNMVQNSKLKASDNGSSQYQERLDDLSAQLKVAEVKSKQEEQKSVQLKLKNDELNALFEASQKNLDEKQKSSESLNTEKTELAKKVEILTKDRNGLDDKIKELTQQIIQLQTVQTGEVSSVKSEASQRTAELAMKLAEAVGQIRSGELTIQQLNEKERDLQQQLAALIIAKSQSDDALRKNQQDIDGIRKEYEAQMDELKQESLRLGNERDTQIIKVNELENALKDEKRSSKSAVEEVRIRLTSELDTLKMTLSQKEAQWLEAESMKKEFIAAKETMDQELKDAQAKVTELQAQQSGRKSTSQEIPSTLEKELRGKIDEVTSQLNVSQGQLAETKQAKQGLEESLKAKESKIEELQAQLTKISKVETPAADDPDKINELQSEIELLAASLKESQRSVTELTNIKTGLERSKADSENKIAELRVQLEQNEKALTEMKSLSEKELVSVKESMGAELRTLTASLKETQRSLTDLTQSKSALEDDLKNKIEIIDQLESEKTEKLKNLTTANLEGSKQAIEEKKVLEGRIEELSKEIKEAKANISELSKTKENLDEQIKSSDIKLIQMTNDLSLRSKELENALNDQKKKEDAAVEETRIRLTSEINTLKLNMSQKETQWLEMEKMNKELISTKDELDQKLVSLQEKEQQNQSKITELQGLLSGKEADTRRTMSDLETELKAKIDEVTSQLTATQGQLAQIKQAKESLEEGVKSKEAKIAELSEAVSSKDKALQELKIQTAEEMSAANNKSQDQLDQLTVNLKESQESVSELTKIKSGLEDNLTTIQSKLEALQVNLAEKESALTEIQKKSSEEIAGLKIKFQGEIEQLSLALNESQRSVSDLTKTKTGLEADLVSERSKAAELKTQLTERENSLAEIMSKTKAEISSVRESMQAEIEQLKIMLDGSKKSTAELTQAKAASDEKLKSSEAKVSELQGQLVEKDNILSEIKKRSAEELTNSKKDLQAEVENLTKSLRESQQAVSLLTKTRSELEDSLQAAQTKVSLLETQVSEKEKLLTEKAEAHTNELAAVKSTMSAQLERATLELKQLQEAQVQTIKLKEKVEAELKVSEDRLQKATLEISRKQEEISSIQGGIPSQITTAKKPLEEKIDILVKSLGDTQSELKLKQSDLETLNGRVSGLERALTETKSAKDDLEKESIQAKTTLENVRQEFTQELDKTKKTMEEKNSEWQKSLDEKNQKIASLTSEKNLLSQAGAQIAADKQRLEQEIIKLKAEIAEQQKSIDDKIAVAKQPELAKIEQLEKTLQEKEMLITQKAEAFTKVSGELTTVLKGLAVVREERDNLSLSVKPLKDKIDAIPQEIELAKRPLEDQNAKLRVELEKVQGMLDVRVKGLEADIDAKNTAYDQAVKARQNMDKEMARLTQLSDKLAQENERLTLKLSTKFQEDCGVAMEEIQKPWKDKIDELRSLLEGRDKEIESFKNENARLNQELGSMVPAAK